MSHVMCHVSHVMCQIVTFFVYFPPKQSGEAYWSRVCYQRGLPRLVNIKVLFVDARLAESTMHTTNLVHYTHKSIHPQNIGLVFIILNLTAFDIKVLVLDLDLDL